MQNKVKEKSSSVHMFALLHTAECGVVWNWNETSGNDKWNKIQNTLENWTKKMCIYNRKTASQQLANRNKKKKKRVV